MRYPALILSLVALPAFGQDAGSPDSGAEPPVGGVGRLACSAIVGPENAAYLGQAGDWALGYMAGRLDAGDELTEGATLSPDDAVDVVAGIAVRCRENPDQPVIEAARGFAERVFGTEAQAGAIAADAPPPPPDVPESAAAAEPPRRTIPPEPRPETAPSDTATAEAADTEPSEADESATSSGTSSSSSASSGASSASTAASDPDSEPADQEPEADTGDDTQTPGTGPTGG